MSETHPTAVPEASPDDHPVPTTEDGDYLVTAPVSGTRPDVIRMRSGDTVYTFSDYDGVERDSAVLPSVLRYETCSVTKVEP